MRCKNCGWPNKPNEKVCVKCHAPLEVDHEESFNSMPGDSDSINRPLNKTVREEDVFNGGDRMYRSENPNEMSTVETKTCPKCGYPVRPDSDICPNCKFSIKQQSFFAQSGASAEQFRYGSNEAKRRPTRMDNETSKSRFRGTINPYMMNMEMEPTFVLKPLKRINERHDFEELEYEGTEVVLNRGNTEANNASITSRRQAVITRVDGHWYIEDQSEQKTTFVQAASKIELHDGDLVLLGNRLFEFHE